MVGSGAGAGSSLRGGGVLDDGAGVDIHARLALSGVHGVWLLVSCRV
ncbi:hypothetical protein [Pseudonocardia ammonioxydans]|nr:hypothetical protein [Pseudonocardia ammonioxydans]